MTKLPSGASTGRAAAPGALSLLLALVAVSACTGAEPSGVAARPTSATSMSPATSIPTATSAAPEVATKPVPDPAHADPVLKFLETDRAWVKVAQGTEYRRAYCAYDRYGEFPGKLFIVAHCSAGGEGSTASVLPAALSVSETGAATSITSFEKPGDGSQNGIDMRRIFPRPVADEMYRKMGSDRELGRRANQRAVDALR